jgi:L-threonylcarbamoyladenylate synthase
VNTEITTDIDLTIHALTVGQVVGVPTETVYGLAANALNETAVKQVFSVKGRPTTNPLILHFATLAVASPFIKTFAEDLHRLAMHFCPGPLTFLVPRTLLVPDLITNGSPLVAIRFPSHPLLQSVLSRVDFPIAAPSANTYGSVSPTTANDVLKQLEGLIPIILDGGPCEFGLESTIVGMDGDSVVIHRLGSVDLDNIAVVLGYIPALKNHTTDTPIAPGMVKYHYATTTPLYYFQQYQQPKANSGYIFLSKIPDGFNESVCITLSRDGDYKEIGRNLYQGLSVMDARGFDSLFIEQPQPIGLGVTILDRLNRATAKFLKD